MFVARCTFVVAAALLLASTGAHATPLREREVEMKGGKAVTVSAAQTLVRRGRIFAHELRPTRIGPNGEKHYWIDRGGTYSIEKKNFFRARGRKFNVADPVATIELAKWHFLSKPSLLGFRHDFLGVDLEHADPTRQYNVDRPGTYEVYKSYPYQLVFSEKIKIVRPKNPDRELKLP